MLLIDATHKEEDMCLSTEHGKFLLHNLGFISACQDSLIGDLPEISPNHTVGLKHRQHMICNNTVGINKYNGYFK